MASYELKDKGLKRSLDLNIFAITLGMVFFTIFGSPVGSPFFTGFMRKLGASDLIYSIVMALPVLGGISQIFGSYFIEVTGKRRFLFLSSGFVHRLLWIPVALIPLIAGQDCREAKIWSITVMITISSIACSVNNIAFNSWMGDLVPLDIAGRFFGKRSLVSTISAAAAGILVGIFVDRVSGFNGFAIVFIIGALFGIGDISTFFFIRHPPVKLLSSKPSLGSILKEPFKNRNYMNFIVFITVFSFGVNIAAPFFNVYMIENLRMNYVMINISGQIMSSLTTVLVIQKWGALSDRYGYKPVVEICSYAIILCPILWLFSAPGHYVLVFISNLISGIGWSGYSLATFNQSVWLAPEKSRSSHMACYTLVTSSVGTALAYVCGGYFMQYTRPLISGMHIPFLFGVDLNSYQVLFLISAAVRAFALAVFLPKIQEENAQPARVLIQEVFHTVRTRFKRNGT